MPMSLSGKKDCSTICAILLINIVSIGIVDAHVGQCESGWQRYEVEEPFTCLRGGQTFVDSLQSAHEQCLQLNASLIIIQSKKKETFFKEFVKNTFGTNALVWLGLQRPSPGRISWLTRDGDVGAQRVPFHFTDWHYRYDSMNTKGILYRNGYASRSDSYSKNAYYICEKTPGCVKGKYGVACDKDCHCYGQECARYLFELRCEHGCQLGWMGSRCLKEKVDADVNYFCVNSEDQGKYAHIHINTKGVDYENIGLVDDQGERIPWCNSSTVDQRSNTMSIKIYVGDNDTQQEDEGPCAGNVVGGEQYQWRLKIQETDGLVSRHDQTVDIICDFSQADHFALTAKAHIAQESWFDESDIKKPVQNLEERKEVVKLQVVNPSTGSPVSETEIGTPVVLRIVFGEDEGNIATGVRPYNCYVSSPNRRFEKQFLDAHGCPMAKMPISAFHKNASKSMITNAFPLFGFDRTEKVGFHCSYYLCFGDDPCPADCVHTLLSSQSFVRRRKRSTRGEDLRIMSTVRIYKRT